MNYLTVAFHLSKLKPGFHIVTNLVANVNHGTIYIAHKFLNILLSCFSMKCIC